MTMECYYPWCKYHGEHIQEPGWDGPFCYEEECLASEEEIKVFRKKRKKELKGARVMYRWRWRTFFPNIWWFIDDTIQGIWNIMRWTPVIWKDRDFDWAYMVEIWEYKFRRMNKCISKYGHHIHYERDARQLLICAELCKRLHKDIFHTHSHLTMGQQEEVTQYYQEYLGKLIGKHLRGWWD